MDKIDILEKDALYKQVSKLVSPIFNKVPQEISKNHMMVGKHGFVKPEICFYQPHNMRVYIDFQRNHPTIFNPKLYIKTKGKSLGDVTYKLINSTEHNIKGYKGCNFRVKKHQVEIYNNINHKKWFPIEMNNKVKKSIQTIISEKVIECITILKDLILNCGGSSKFKILRIVNEDKIQSEKAIDLISKKLVFHNEVCKKVYPNQKNVEFNNSVYTSNYLINRSVENITPEIIHAINSRNPLRALKNNVNCMDDVLKNYNLIKLLTQSETTQFSNWCIMRFGIHA